MNWYGNWVSLVVLTRKEIKRILRIWTQSLLPSVITVTLYFVVFGEVLGSRIEQIQGFEYINYIVPGLVMMAIITNSFQNVVGSFFLAKFQRSIEELLVSPMPSWAIITGYALGGVIRGSIVGGLVLLVSLFFTQLPVTNIFIVLVFTFLTSVLFSLGGLINGVFARNFDQISIVPTFVLTPLTFLGGVFYSLEDIPQAWATVSYFNPILYMVNGFRYGFLGYSDVSVWLCFGVLTALLVLVFFGTWLIFRTGYGLKE